MNDINGQNNNNDYGRSAYDSNNGYNNGYSRRNYGGGYFPDGSFDGGGMYSEEQPPERKGGGFAIAAFVISLVNIPCCTLLSIVSIPLCIIFSIITFAGKRKGTGFAVASLIISLVSGVFFAFYAYIAYKVAPDFLYFSQNTAQLIEEYEETGEIPERFEKYRDPKFDKYWENSNCEDFDDFYGQFIEAYKEENGITTDRSSFDDKEPMTTSISTDAHELALNNS